MLARSEFIFWLGRWRSSAPGKKLLFNITHLRQVFVFLLFRNSLMLKMFFFNALIEQN